MPQGSLLGPSFFVIFIGDLPEVVMPGNCVSLYADDCKTSRIINCPADHYVSFSQGPAVRTPVSPNPGFNFNPGFFFFLSKAHYRINFSIRFREIGRASCRERV